jgi:hypothetical protein
MPLHQNRDLLLPGYGRNKKTDQTRSGKETKMISCLILIAAMMFVGCGVDDAKEPMSVTTVVEACDRPVYEQDKLITKKRSLHKTSYHYGGKELKEGEHVVFEDCSIVIKGNEIFWKEIK